TIANEDSPGAVYVELPENLAAESVASRVLAVRKEQPLLPPAQAIEAAFSCLNQCERPFILIGRKAIMQDACEEVLAFSTILQAPCTHSFMAKGLIPKESPINYFTFGFNENDLVLSGIDEADLLIVIGFDPIERLPKEWNRKRIPI